MRTRVRCVYSGWSRHGNTLACREAFGSPAAVAKHVANVGGSVEALKAGAGATLTGTLFHSSQLNIESYLKAYEEMDKSINDMKVNAC